MLVGIVLAADDIDAMQQEPASAVLSGHRLGHVRHRLRARRPPDRGRHQGGLGPRRHQARLQSRPAGLQRLSHAAVVGIPVHGTLAR
ncbi:hypothetical protein G7054_g2212 [Neopestalotiopsis clavispora]|nr:hypothetical protein G7054_g2212 [Neopestalotiopsis clavispora]